MEKELKVPKISEESNTGIVAEVFVEEGESIEEGQDIIALDSDKASVEIPAEASGKIKSINIQEGDEVEVGEVILVLEVENHKDRHSDEEKKPEKSRPSEQNKEATAEDQEEEKTDEVAKTKATGPAADTPSAPLAKKFARELGIDLKELQSDDPEDRITREDVMDYARKIIESRSGKQRPDGSKGIPPITLPDFSKYGGTERQPLSGIRSSIAENTLVSWQNMPHVTHHDKADLSLLESYLNKKEKAGEKLSMTAVITKIAGEALRHFPKFNASLDLENKEIIYKKYYHISIAVDTNEGLLMPVIRDVDEKQIDELSGELAELAQKARDRRLKPKEMEGGNFAISNLGGIGGEAFSPVIFPPQCAILGISSAEIKPVYNGSDFEPKPVLPLSLSYDHRLIDGAEAARFLRWMVEVIEQPFKLLEG